MNTEIIQDYINVEQFHETIFEMYKEEREGWRDAENSDFLDLEYDDEVLNEMAWAVATETNDSMKRYLHRDDYHMDGNFANILYDYASYRTNKCCYERAGIVNDRELLEAMIERLDKGEDSPRANDDRDYLSSWIFHAFGTFGFRYNFSNIIADALCTYEQEMAYA